MLSYACLIERNGPNPANLTPGTRFRGKMTVTNSVAVPLFADVTIQETTGSYIQITSTSGITPYHTTSHLEKGSQPAGGNILYMDGHVQWRRARDMAIRYRSDGTRPIWWF